MKPVGGRGGGHAWCIHVRVHAHALACMWVCECLCRGGFARECGCFSGVVSTCSSHPALPQSPGVGELGFMPTRLHFPPSVTHGNSPKLTWAVVSALLELYRGKDEPGPGDTTTTAILSMGD